MNTTATASTAPSGEAMQSVVRLITGHIVGSAVYVAAKLDIAGRLASGPRTAAELARDCGVNEDALYRVLRALASVGVFEETSPRTFALTPTAAALSDPGVRALAVWIASPFSLRVYTELMHSVETGAPAVEKAFGMGAFEYFAHDPATSAIFNDAMVGMSRVVIPAVLEAYDFSDIRVLVDVAGGHGGVVSAVLAEYPSMRGILFDIEHVIAGARPRIESLGLAGRCTMVVGDFFEAVPAGGDAYLMKHIIHDWDDERASRILRNIRAVLPADGRLLLLESVVPAGNEPSFGKILDLEMLVMPGGRERTDEEFRALLAGAGFELTRIVPTKSPLSVIEGRPRR